MTEWKTYRLGDICDYVTSRTSRIENYISTENMLPNKGGVCTPSNVPNGTAIEYKSGDILISNIRPYFQKIWQADCNGACSADVLCIRANNKADSKYLYYLLSQQLFFDYVMAGAKGCKMPRGDKKQIMQWQISLPGLEEQRRIAGILGAIDDKIENNRRINTNLELQAQALYKQWFVDFEFPNEEGKPYKSSGGKMIDSELGPIPDGWSVGLLKDVVSFQSGFAFKSDLFIDSGKYRLITIKGVQDGYLDINGAVYINDIPNKMPSYCLLEEGDIIMSLTGNVGRCCVVDRENLLLNQRVVKLQPTLINSNMFIYTMFRRESFKEKLIALAKGTAQANLSPIETANLHTILPDNSIMKKYCEYGEPIFASLLNNIKESINLATLRDTLLPKLMNGEIKL